MKKVLSTILVLSLFILTGCSAATKDPIRTVETVKGKIEIPNEPKRVVIDYFCWRCTCTRSGAGWN